MVNVINVDRNVLVIVTYMILIYVINVHLVINWLNIIININVYNIHKDVKYIHKIEQIIVNVKNV